MYSRARSARRAVGAQAVGRIERHLFIDKCLFLCRICILDKDHQAANGKERTFSSGHTTLASSIGMCSASVRS